MKKEIEETIELAKSWLLYSGIQNESDNPKIDGGFNSWYDPKKKIYPYIYSEITGYALTILSYLYHLQPEEILLKRSKKAASWLMNQAAHQSGAVKTRYYFGKTQDKADFSKQVGTLYTFDTGVVLFGICHLYQITKEKKYLDYAQKLTSFLLSMRKPGGSFYAFFDPKKKKKVDVPDKWSTQSGAFHAKLALGLLALFGLTKDKTYKEAAEGICDWALSLQKSDGRFVTFKDTSDTHLHPHCYAAEGLYYAGKFLGKDNYLQAAKKAAEWALSGQMKNGGIPSMFYQKSGWGRWERTDELAQVLRIGVLSNGATKEKLSKLVKRILTFQSKSKDKHLNGGMKYGYEEGKKLSHVNPHCTVFTLQALLFYQDYLSGSFPSWEFII